MDSVGTLELSWCQGYTGSKVCYIGKDVVCYLSGNNVKFVAEDGAETVFNFTGNGAGVLAIHSINSHFAIGEQSLNPKIFIFVYPTFRQIGTLEGGAQLEFSNLAFSNSNYFASVSGLPDFELVLWDYTNATKLTAIQLNATPLTSLSFNPANWRQIFAVTEKNMTILQTEQCNEKYLLQPKSIKSPPEDPTLAQEEEKERIPSRASTRMSRYTVDVPKAAIAGLVGEMSDKLEEIQDETVRVIPYSHAWTPSGDVYVGCLGGQLLKIDGESFKARVVYFPPPRAETPHSRAVSASSKHPSMVDMSTIVEDVGTLLLEGSLNCIALHRQGLYAVGQEGVLRLIDLKGDECRVVEQCTIGVPVMSMDFSPCYKRLIMASDRGMLHLYEAGFADSLRLLKDTHYGNFVGLACIPGTQHCVTVREDGTLQVWTQAQGLLVSAMSVGFQATSLACSPLFHCAVVGTVTGHLYFVDLSDVDEPRIVQSIRVYNSPVLSLMFDDEGKYLFTGSDEGTLFILNGQASKQFHPIGHTDVPGEVQNISVYSGKISLKVIVACNTSGKKRNGADTLVQLEVREDIMSDPRMLYKSLKKDLNVESVRKLMITLPTPSYGAVVTKGSIVYSLSQRTKKLQQFRIPDEKPQKGKSIAVDPELEFAGHELPGGNLLMSPHQKWLATYGADGAVHISFTGSLGKYVKVTPHDYRNGGVRIFIFSEDCQRIFTTGCDGVLTAYCWNLTVSGSSKIKSAVEAARTKKSKLMSQMEEEDKVMKAMDEWVPTFASRPSSAVVETDSKERLAREKAMETDEIYTTPTPVAPGDSTWYQIQLLEAHKEEDKQYTDLKKDLRVQIRDMRRTIQDMMRKNENLPEIEKLGRHEFDLDIEEQNRLQAESEAEIQRVREEIEFENLAKMYLREMIKKECWDDMKVKGRAIQAFNSSLEVSNFPLKERTVAQQNALDMVTKRRQIEIQELAARREEADTVKKPATTALLLSMIQQQMYSDLDEDAMEGEESDANKKEQPATTGSLGAQYGGDSDLFLSQFDLHTREQKTSQIVLLEDAIHRIRVAFNKDFDEVFRKKEQEIDKIKEKNRRISKIMRDLDLNEPLVEPAMSVVEKPERLLTVEDSEIKVEKFMTPEQKKKYEEQLKVEEERRQREAGDNARERALDDMMGGLLEIKKEDELKKDVPKPAYIMSKPQEEWTEDEIKIVKDYEKRVKDLQEEREKYRKQLETELRKLQGVIQEAMTGFDDALNVLFLRKIKVMMVIYQEELKILRLRSSLLVEEELDTREKELNRLLEHKKELKHFASLAYVEARKHVEAYRELYDNLVAEDKLIDKGFKREFMDVSAVMQDTLYRLFRRRPRIPKLRGGVETSVSSMDQKGPNPFAERPSTARQNVQTKIAMETAVDDMDKGSNIPEGLDNSVWERFCVYRREKIESEQMVRLKALVLAEMNAFMQSRHEEDEQLKDSIDEILDLMNKVKEDKLRFNLNLEVQLLLKQGQVEADSSGSFINDYTDSVLLHRSVIEDLNTNIKQLGESKITSMVESKDFRMGIIQLEWDQKRMLMQMEDLQNKMKDIQFMKVSREIQLYLNEKDYEGKKSEEISKLEQSILVLKKHHERHMDDKSRNLRDLKKSTKQKDNENVQVERKLQELNVSVNERRHIDEVNADRRTDAGAEKRYQEIVQRRKLVDLAKAQAQEVAVLRAEVERLRMRTFPALVQVEH